MYENRLHTVSESIDFDVPTRWFCMSPYHKGPRWLLAYNFYVDRKKKRLQSYCACCARRATRESNKRNRDKRRVYDRETKAMRRRAAGIPVRKLINPNGRYGEGRTMVQTEWVPAAPIRRAVKQSKLPKTLIEHKAGMSGSEIFDILKSTRAWIKLDEADRIAYALGTTVNLLYSDDDVVVSLTAPRPKRIRRSQ